MTRLFLPFSKTILRTNIIFSILLTILSGLLFISEFKTINIFNFIATVFIIWIMTGGFVISVFFFELSRKDEYYFYYNLGIGKIRLLLVTYLLHIIFIAPVLLILLIW